MEQRAVGADTEIPDPLLREASPLRRLIATLADMLIYCSLCVAIAWPVASGINWSAVPTDIDEFFLRISDTAWVSHASGVLGMWIALWWCYFLVGWGLFGGTPGNWLTRTRVVDLKGRYPMGLSRAAMRLAGYIVNAITLGLGHLLMFRSDRKALHDMLAGTRVVCRRPRPKPTTEPQPEEPDPPGRPDDDDEAEADEVESSDPEPEGADEESEENVQR